jgi:hypothetical protein
MRVSPGVLRSLSSFRWRSDEIKADLAELKAMQADAKLEGIVARERSGRLRERRMWPNVLGLPSH